MTEHSQEYYHQKISTLEGLPSLPSVAAEILALKREDKLSINQMLPTIERDPPLALKLLKMANSAYYGRRYKVDSLKQAIVTIGLNDLTYLVLSFSIIKSFIMDGGQTFWIDWTQYWRHSIACAFFSQAIAKKWNLSLPANPYTMGLLHDIGKLVLFRLDQRLFMRSLEMIKKEGVSSIEAENELFGIDHTIAGKWLTETWDMPATIQAAIGYHHSPNQCPNPEFQPLVALVQITDGLCNLHQPNIVDLRSKLPIMEFDGWDILQPDLPVDEEEAADHLWSHVSGELPHIDSVLNMLKES